MSEIIACNADFSFKNLLDFMADRDAQVGHIEEVIITTGTQRITLYVGVVEIEDITPKLHLVK